MSSVCQTEDFKIPEEIVNATQFGFLKSQKPHWLTCTDDLRGWQKECVQKFEKKMAKKLKQTIKYFQKKTYFEIYFAKMK